MDLYHQVSRNKKVETPYTRFYKKRYLAYAKQLPGSGPNEISKLIGNDWNKLPEKDRKRLNDEYISDQEDLKRKLESEELLKEYEEACEEFNKELTAEKEKLYKKYGFNKEVRKQERRRVRKQDQMKRRMLKQEQKARKHRAFL